MEPAHSIITKLGGPSIVAGVVGIHRTRVSNWSRPAAKGGTGGRIPQKYHLALIDYGATQGIEIKAADFLPVREQAA